MLLSETVQITFNETEEYSLKSIAILGYNKCSQIKVAHVTLPKAVLSTVEIFAVWCTFSFQADLLADENIWDLNMDPT